MLDDTFEFCTVTRVLGMELGVRVVATHRESTGRRENGYQLEDDDPGYISIVLYATDNSFIKLKHVTKEDRELLVQQAWSMWVKGTETS